nr:hypothetical protein [Massilia sp. JS1662]
MIKYSDLGAHRRLNEIVMAGSHDAGITGGDKNAQTQTLDIGQQARAGVRFFDLRIAAFATNQLENGVKKVEMRAFHADGMLHKVENKTRGVVGATGTAVLERSKLKGGTDKGLGLAEMLDDAYDFVSSADFSSEFLILKFDKCTNWKLIAGMCQARLGQKLYTGGGNLNTKTLADLAGKVIVAFMPEGYAQLDVNERVGITPIKNLYKPPANYDPAASGLQYWGAGGTSPMNGKTQNGKMQENISKQSKIMRSATMGVKVKKHFQFARSVEYRNSAASPHAMGMMYWTTTGLLASIKSRNDNLWTAKNRLGLSEMWLNMFMEFAEYLQNALPDNINLASYSSGGTLKMFMPNIVMIDFADDDKCQYIYDLNNLAAVRLAAVTRAIELGQEVG